MNWKNNPIMADLTAVSVEKVRDVRIRFIRTLFGWNSGLGSNWTA